MAKMIPEEEFYEKYKPQVNHIVRDKTDASVADEDICSFNGTMYETYGEELEYITNLSTNEMTAKKVWTVVEVEDEEEPLCIIAGFRIVNRQGYIVTENEWETGEEEVEY